MWTPKLHITRRTNRIKGKIYLLFSLAVQMVQNHSSQKREIAPVMSDLLLLSVFHHLQSSSFRETAVVEIIRTSKFQTLTSAGAAAPHT